MTTMRACAYALVSAALVACGGASSTGPMASVTGNWSGQAGFTTLSVSVVDNAGTLSGRGDFDSGTGSVVCVNAIVTGSAAGALSFNLDGPSAGSLAVCVVSFVGQVNGSTATGTVFWNDGSSPITLTRP